MKTAVSHAMPGHGMGNERKGVVFPLSSFQALRTSTVTIRNMDMDGYGWIWMDTGGREGRGARGEAGGAKRVSLVR